VAEKKISEERAAELKSNLKQSSIQNTQRLSGIFNDSKSGGSKQSVTEKKIFEGAAINRTSPRKNVDQLSRPLMNKNQVPQQEETNINDNAEESEPQGSPEEPFGYDLNAGRENPNNNRQPSRTDSDLQNLQASQLETNNLDETVPGGQALPTTNQTKTNDATKSVQSEESAGTKNVAGKTGQSSRKVEDAGQQMAKIAANAAKWAGNGLRVFFSGPVGWLVIGIVLALFIFIIIFSIYYFRSNSSPSFQGKSPLNQTHPLTDKEWIQQVLILAGDKDTSKLMSDSALNKMKNELANIKTQIEKDGSLSAAEKEAYTAKIDLILPKIDSVKLATDANKKKILSEIVANLADLAKSFLSVSALPASIETRLPIRVALGAFNTHPHLGTVGWPSVTKPTGYPSPARTFLQTGDGTCDAVDLKVGGNIDVFAAFNGKITKVSGAPAVENTENKVVAIYGHVDLDSNLSSGSEVKAGEHIGKTQVSQGHLHFELAVGNSSNTWKCVTNSREEVNSAKAANWPENQVGKILWDKMLLVLHSPKLPGE